MPSLAVAGKQGVYQIQEVLSLQTLRPMMTRWLLSRHRAVVAVSMVSVLRYCTTDSVWENKSYRVFIRIIVCVL